MISSYLYVIFAITFLAICFYIFFIHTKVTYTYIIDGADLRVCTMSQCMVFLALINIELFYFLFKKESSYVDIYLFRTYVPYMFYFMATSRLLRYKSLFFPKKLKNLFYIIIVMGFYVTTIIEVFCLPKLDIHYDVGLSRLGYACRVIGADCGTKEHAILHSMPAIYALICYLFIITFDTLERRRHKTLLLDTLTDIPIILYTIITLSKEARLFSEIMFIIIYIIPLFGIIFEIKNIMHYCSKERDDTKYLRQLIIKSYRLQGAKRLYTARLISKLLKSNPSLEQVLPGDSKFEDFLTLVKEYESEKL